MIIALRTDKPESEIYLVQADGQVVASKQWEAGRQLTSTILETMQDLLQQNGATWQTLDGVIIYKGPGSFTGLRIGAAVGNAVADSRQVAVVGTQSEDWLKRGVARLQRGENDRVVLPEYGALANISHPLSKSRKHKGIDSM